MKRITTLLILAATTFAPAHPHFRKTVTAQLPGGVEASLSYTTVPSNEEHTRKLAVGGFVTPRSPSLTLSGDIRSGSTQVAAGNYTVGLLKNGEEDWTLVLYPGTLGRGDTPEPARMVHLDSLYERSKANAGHLQIDITPGHGNHEGKAVLSIAFGTMTISGALS